MKLTVAICVVALCGFFSANAHEVSSLKKSLLFNYDKTSKPTGQVVVTVGIEPKTIDLCPHKKVDNNCNQVQHFLSK
jgi:hypothetical protein